VRALASCVLHRQEHKKQTPTKYQGEPVTCFQRAKQMLINHVTGSSSGYPRMMICAATASLFITPLLGQTPGTGKVPDQMGSAYITGAVSRPSLLKQLNNSMEAMVEKTSPAVVQVLVTGYGPVQQHGEEDVAVLAPEKALGSGVIVDPDGYIITNAHVIHGAQRIRVILPLVPSSSTFQLRDTDTGKVFEAKVVGVDTGIDLAVLKVDASHLPILPLTDSPPVRQGQLVFAIGSPEGLENSVTMGVISSPLRQPDADNPRVYIQTDTPINPGNSGGPLVDVDGRVVGINTMILTEGGGSEGIGFAIPAAIVRFEYASLRKSGHVAHATISATVQAITPTLAAGLGLQRGWGAVVSDVTPDGPADAAGLRIGDIVLSVDGHAIVGVSGYNAALSLHGLDQVLKIEVLRDQRTLSLSLPVIEHHDQRQLADVPLMRKNLLPRLGIFAVELDSQVREILTDLRSDSGVVVLAGTAAPAPLRTGLKAGDIVRAVNRSPVASLPELRAAVKNLKAGDSAVLQIERNGKLQYLAFEVDE
jgi:serine protease Do